MKLANGNRLVSTILLIARRTLHSMTPTRTAYSVRNTTTQAVLSRFTAEGNFEEKMATLLVWRNVLNRSVPAFAEAQRLPENGALDH